MPTPRGESHAHTHVPHRWCEQRCYCSFRGPYVCSAPGDANALNALPKLEESWVRRSGRACSRLPFGDGRMRAAPCATRSRLRSEESFPCSSSRRMPGVPSGGELTWELDEGGGGWGSPADPDDRSGACTRAGDGLDRRARLSAGCTTRGVSITLSEMPTPPGYSRAGGLLLLNGGALTVAAAPAAS